MPRGYPALTAKQKQEIVARISDDGEKVSDLSKEYGVVPKTIYNLLKKTKVQDNLYHFQSIMRDIGKIF